MVSYSNSDGLIKHSIFIDHFKCEMAYEKYEIFYHK